MKKNRYLYKKIFFMAKYDVIDGEGIIPEGTTIIEMMAFYGCSDLVSVLIPDSVTKIDNCAFLNCARLTSVIIPDSVTRIGNGAFGHCIELKSVVLSNNLKEIEDEAFYNCSSLTHLVIPHGCLIGTRAFYGAGLEEVDIYNNDVGIYEETFCNCRRLTKVDINFVRYIDDRVFMGCINLNEFDIPESAEYIGERAFMGCMNLNEVVIPESVKYIGDEAFAGCSGLMSMVIYECLDEGESRRRKIGSNVVDNRLLGAFNYVIEMNYTRRIVDNGDCISVEMIDENAEGVIPVWIPDKVFEMFHKEHEWVDLGLSVKWATCNVGASSPSNYGLYFAWGETTPKDESTQDNLRYCKIVDTVDTYTKYNTQSEYGNVDNKTCLELGDDAACANWGGNWRMPTDAEWTELRERCRWKWTEQDGKKGYEVRSKSNGNSIFLPAAGGRQGTDLYVEGSVGFFWSSSLGIGNPDAAWAVFFSPDGVGRYTFNRCSGFSVRPVRINDWERV